MKRRNFFMSLIATALGVKAAPAVVAAAPRLVGIWAFRDETDKVVLHGVTEEQLQSRLGRQHRAGGRSVRQRLSAPNTAARWKLRASVFWRTCRLRRPATR